MQSFFPSAYAAVGADLRERQFRRDWERLMKERICTTTCKGSWRPGCAGLWSFP